MIDGSVCCCKATTLLSRTGPISCFPNAKDGIGQWGSLVFKSLLLSQ